MDRRRQTNRQPTFGMPVRRREKSPFAKTKQAAGIKRLNKEDALVLLSAWRLDENGKAYLCELDPSVFHVAADDDDLRFAIIL